MDVAAPHAAAISKQRLDSLTPEDPEEGSLVQAVKVNSLGKWKTALQMAAMSGMLLLRQPGNLLGHDHASLEHAQRASHACLLLLWAGAFLSV